MARPPLRLLASVALVCAACSPPAKPPPTVTPISVADHARYFPIDPGTMHAVDKVMPDGVTVKCETCHQNPEAVTQVTCIGCHKHPLDPILGRDVQDTLHLDAPDYATKVPPGADAPTRSAGCFSCHTDGKRLLSHFPHGGIKPGAKSFCIMCHEVGNPFAALPKAGFTHIATGGTDCGACHHTDTWKNAVGVPMTVADPDRNLNIATWTPRYSGPTMASATPNNQVITMTMDHSAHAIDATVLTTCKNCHAALEAQGTFYPGALHASLDALGKPQPATCDECHGNSSPINFVGTADPRRAPITGPMKHDAVDWVNGVQGTTRLLTADCATCHVAPGAGASNVRWTTGRSGSGPVAFHAELADAGLAQPGDCIDCHANTRPWAPVQIAQVVFDHTTDGLGSCKDCHASTTQWAGGRFHLSGASTTLTTCLPCHAGERPTATTGWMGDFTTSPFDYVTNYRGVRHGDGLDCATCHAGPGSGAWGVNQNWQRGSFLHAPASVAAATCLACHSTQRPDRLTPAVDAGYDHATSGTGDCFGCHQATVARNTYVKLLPFPGDWRDGQAYPGSNLIGGANAFVQLDTTSLTRTGTTVTGMVTTTATLSNGMRHTSAQVPAALFPEDGGTPNSSTCWHCHTATGTTVTAFANGQYHASLTNFRATPGGAIAALPQPTTGCADCHSQMRPPNIVAKTDAGISWLQPMDHAAAFTGGSVANVGALDCSTCHHSTGAGGAGWSDGKFHANVPAGARPADCVSCHYPLITTPASDLVSTTDYAMKHRSTFMPTQACATCHQQALAASTTAPLATPLWRSGAFHASLTATTQPAACVDCHAISEPTAPTQGTVTYALTEGATATNGAQWMNHADPAVLGKDCVTCHRADAKVTGAAWSKSTALHTSATVVTTCASCHGLANGQGSIIGENNNLPTGLITTTTLTTSSVTPTLKAQLTHADLNVTTYDCSVCHTQRGASTVAGIQGKEWQQAKFHANFTGSRALVMNNTTGRCSNCHLNVKPPGIVGGQDHAPFSTVAGTQDCSSCHVLPGTGTLAAPNWKGAVPAPSDSFDPGQAITVNAWTPRYGGTAMLSATPGTQSLNMTMNHGSLALDAGVVATCANCHLGSVTGNYYPGTLHTSLATLGVPQPASCNDCHGNASPLGFVGPADARRVPTTGEMKHDAVAWVNNVPTTTKVVTAGCATCHLAPATGSTTWADGLTGGSVAYHSALTAGGLPQPASCLDCHANSRPTTLVLSGSLTFDHATSAGDCKSCHTSTSAWVGGRYHLAGQPTPTTCLPCHETERPLTTSGWVANFTTSPFDYVTNLAGVKHGDSQDCAVCHNGPGTGAWGVNQNFQNGRFSHAPATVAATTCAACHTTQRPDRLTPPVDAGFDHAANGTGDCIGCHLATVSRNTFVALTPIPGGDWRGGQEYPGAAVISAPNAFVQVQTTTLTRAGQVVTGMSSSGVTLANGMLHTSAQIPAALFPGLAAAPDSSTCWHCHTATGTTVTAYANGKYHASLTNFRATPAAAITALPQPTSGCGDCHEQMRPPHIVSKTDAGVAWLLPMDHAATLAGGAVGTMDCASCHSTPGTGATAWSDGLFHARIGSAPTDCVTCHYPLMTTPAADVTLATTYAMKHQSAAVPTQACATCHTTALAGSTTTPTATALWKTGKLHGALTATTQPASCLDCHAISEPTVATQGTVSYILQLGGTATNGAQWMNHAERTVVGKDCVSCHRADAKVTGSAWNRATAYHATTTGLTVCATCHGTTNGRGTVIGTNNNLPAGLSNSTMVTTSTVSPGLYAQLTHADVNVTGNDCSTCHTQAGPSTVAAIRGYEWAQAKFHPNFGTGRPLTINGSTGRCSNCHLNVKPPAVAGGQDHSTFTAAVGSQDCSSCHIFPGTGTTAAPNWLGAVAAPQNAFDPNKNVSVATWVPRYSGASLVTATPTQVTLNMTMNHAAQAVDAGVLVVCANCHVDAPSGVYYPGLLHSSLAQLNEPQPSKCVECHTSASPAGFVGTADTRRSPITAEMKHDAVDWTAGAPTTVKLVTADCAKCHLSPSTLLDAKWTMGKATDGGVAYHDALADAGLAQPGTCIDCHANNRPGLVAVGLVSFDHGSALGNCKDCHASTKVWTGGKYHLTTSPLPTTCLPCHDGERPTTTTGWLSNYTTSPFDYVTNSLGATHGDGLDCVKCHTTAGTGAWGVNQNWAAGRFTHGVGTPSATTCSACHTTQRPDLLRPVVDAGYDHATNGTGDCIGCHLATVSRGVYTALLPVPGGDWRGGVSYPGSSLINAPNAFVQVQNTSLTKSGTTVTGMVTSLVTLSNGMLHTSAQVPAALFPGPAGAPINSTCWHCHTATGTTVTSYANGKFHAALSGYKATPTSAVTPLPEPTAGCNDCHAQMRPPNIVSKTDGGTWLLPMDHAANLSFGSVSTMDCSTCHHTPGLGGAQWSDGKFHPNAPAAPSDCVSCHYPLMTTALADVTFPDSGVSNFSMKHRSTLVTTQACNTCHLSALTAASTTPATTLLWRPGALHSTLTATTQPASCLDCHATTDPVTATQSTVTYTLPLGGTATNGAQWMNHADPTVAVSDCVTCHQADAKISGAAWSKASSYHSHVTGVTGCATCHGTSNGNGAGLGTGNNLPATLTNTTTTTSSSVSPTLKDQITHGDVNVTGYDCAVCHTQQGPSTVAGITGKEWLQAKFHANFSATRVLMMNTTTGRCSNCHLNIKPPALAGGQDHSTFTAASGTQDCSTCHSYPGTGTAAAPNWKGAAGYPTYITVGGFTILSPPAPTAGTTQVGINNLPHPDAGASLPCTTCHPVANPNHKPAIGYDHASTLINSNCAACHEAGSGLVTPTWSSTTHGDTRVLGTVLVKDTLCSPGHFFPIDCKECHKAPTGYGVWTTGAAAKAAWYVPHIGNTGNKTIQALMNKPATCYRCHAPTTDGGCGVTGFP